MRFRPANNSLINSRSSPPTPPAAIVIQSCNLNFSEFFSRILVLRLTGPSITGCDQQRAGTPIGNLKGVPLLRLQLCRGRGEPDCVQPFLQSHRSVLCGNSPCPYTPRLSAAAGKTANLWFSDPFPRTRFQCTELIIAENFVASMPVRRSRWLAG